MTNKSKSSGFTLIELLVAIGIIAMVFAIVITSAAGLQRQSRDSQRKADLAKIQSALQQYYADQSKFPGQEELTDTSKTELKSPDGTKIYIRPIPRDPNGTAYYYRPILNMNQPLDNCSASSGTCHYYYLCAKMENPSDGAACYDGSYDYQLTPL